MIPTPEFTGPVEQRALDLMLDGPSTVEILEDIQHHGGLAHKSLCASLTRLLAAQTRAAADRALDDACQVFYAFARERARRELAASEHGGLAS